MLVGLRKYGETQTTQASSSVVVYEIVNLSYALVSYCYFTKSIKEVRH